MLVKFVFLYFHNLNLFLQKTLKKTTLTFHLQRRNSCFYFYAIKIYTTLLSFCMLYQIKLLFFLILIARHQPKIRGFSLLRLGTFSSYVKIWLECQSLLFSYRSIVYFLSSFSFFLNLLNFVFIIERLFLEVCHPTTIGAFTTSPPHLLLRKRGIYILFHLILIKH